MERITLNLGSGNDTLYVASTHEATTEVYTGDEVVVGDVTNDVVNINSILGQTMIDVEDGNDVMRVNFDEFGIQTEESGVQASLTLRGSEGNDTFKVGLAGGASATIEIEDEVNGTDRLDILGTSAADLFLFRANQTTLRGMIATFQIDENREPIEGGYIERVNYGAEIDSLVVEGRDGDDTFVFDDTFSPFTVYGDDGNDTFQLGQVFDSARDDANPTNGLDPEDYFETTQTTRGFLSNGLSETAQLFGGTGEDQFTVYRNMAEVFMYGEEGDDSFLVRAFVRVNRLDPKAPFTNINGGDGADAITYTVNAPVNIEGGDGFDTLIVVGTEFGDDFVVNDSGVFGGGLYITYDGVEKVVVDALEGNDRFFIASTSEGVEVEVVGGLGSDTFNVGGNDGNSITVVSNSLSGHNGLIAQELFSTYGESLFDGIFVPDLVVQIGDNDEAGVVIAQENGPLRVFEGQDPATTSLGDLMVRSYTVVLTRAPEETVRVVAAPIALSEREEAAGAVGLQVRAQVEEGVATEEFSSRGVTLTFTRDNWQTPQTVEVWAPEDLTAEGRRSYNIQHRVIEGGRAADGGAYDSLAVRNVAVEVYDDDAADVAVIPLQATRDDNGALVIATAADGSSVRGTADDRNLVSEDPLGFAEDYYAILLTRTPASPVTITLAEILGDENVGQIELYIDQVLVDQNTTLTLSSVQQVEEDEGVDPSYIEVRAINDSNPEAGHFATVGHAITSDLSAFFNVARADVARELVGQVNGGGNGWSGTLLAEDTFTFSENDLTDAVSWTVAATADRVTETFSWFVADLEEGLVLTVNAVVEGLVDSINETGSTLFEAEDGGNGVLNLIGESESFDVVISRETNSSETVELYNATGLCSLNEDTCSFVVAGATINLHGFTFSENDLTDAVSWTVAATADEVTETFSWSVADLEEGLVLTVNAVVEGLVDSINETGSILFEAEDGGNGVLNLIGESESFDAVISRETNSSGTVELYNATGLTSGYVLEAVNLHRFAFFESGLTDATSWTVAATSNEVTETFSWSVADLEEGLVLTVDAVVEGLVDSINETGILFEAKDGGSGVLNLIGESESFDVVISRETNSSGTVELYNATGLTDGLDVSGVLTLRYDLDFQDVRDDLEIDDRWELALKINNEIFRTENNELPSVLVEQALGGTDTPETLEQLLDRFAEELNAESGLSVTHSNAVIQITSIGGSAFTAEPEVTVTNALGEVQGAVNLHRFAFFESGLTDATSWTVAATSNEVTETFSWSVTDLEEGLVLTVDAVVEGLVDSINKTGSILFEAEDGGNGVLNLIGESESFDVVISRETNSSGTVELYNATGLTRNSIGVTSYHAYEVTITGDAALYGAWGLDLVDGETVISEYRYLVGGNGEVSLLDQLDVQILDDDQPGVFVSENGETVVIEPTSQVLLGSGSVVGVPYVTETIFGHITFADAQDLESAQGDFGYWTVVNSALIDESTITPHVSVVGKSEASNAGGVVYEYFSFDVPEASAGRVILNVTSGEGGDGGGAGLVVQLWNETAGSVVAHSGDVTELGGQVYEGLTPSDQFAARISGTEAMAYILHVSVSDHSYDLAFAADFGLAEIRETTEIHSSRLDAQTIEFGRWSQNSDSDIESSTEIPHLTILGSGDGENDFYSFEASAAMLASGSSSIRGVFDIDYGYEEGDSLSWASVLTLYDSVGTTLATSAASNAPELGEAGSNTFADAYLEYLFDAEGTYYIEVSDGEGQRGLPEGTTYELQVSVEEHRVDGFIFSPEPVLEDEDNDAFTDAQVLDAQGNWFIFFDAEVGDGANITSSVPYVRVVGAGDGTSDFFQFDITQPMLTPQVGGSVDPDDTVNTTIDASDFFTEVELTLQGTVSVGDVWTLGLRYRDYSYPVTDSDIGNTNDESLASVAAGLLSLVSDVSRFNQPDEASEVNGTVLTIRDALGFNLVGADGSVGLSQERSGAGQITSSLRVEDNEGGLAELERVEVSFSGDAASDEALTITLNGTPYTPVDGAGDLASRFETAIDEVGLVASASVDGILTIAVASPNSLNAGVGVNTVSGGFTFVFTVEGNATGTTAVVQATPTASELATTSFESLSIAFVGAVRAGEQWVLSLSVGDESHTYSVPAGSDSLPDLAEQFRVAIAAQSSTTGIDVTASDAILTISSSNDRVVVDSLLVTPSGEESTVSGPEARLYDFSEFLASYPNLATEDAEQWNLTATDSSGSEVFGWVVSNPGQALRAAQIAAALADDINSDYASGVTGYQALADSAGGLTVLGGTEVFDLGISVILESGDQQSVIYERQITIDAADTANSTSWTMTVTDENNNETTFASYDSSGTANPTAAQVATGLAGTVSGADYSVVDGGNGTLTLSRTGTSFEVAVSVTRTSGEVEVVNSNTVHERQITIDAADTVNSAGSTWTMLATPAGGVATTIATWTDTSGGTTLSAAAVAAGLAGDVDGNGHYSVVELANNGNLSGSTFTLSRTGTSFEVSVSVSRSSTPASVEVVNTNTVHERQITIDAADTANSTSWTMTVTDENNNETTFASYDSSGTANPPAAQVATGLAGTVSGADYSVVDGGNGTLTLSRTGTSFEVAVSVTRTSGSVEVVNSNTVHERQITIDAADTVNSTGSTWTMLATPAGGVATTIATWTDTSGGTTLSAAAVAAGLAGDVDGDYSVVELANNGTLSGSTFTLSRTGTSFEVSVSVERNSTSASVEVVNTNTVHERQITIDAADTVNSTGSTWTMLATPAGGVATTIATWTDTSGGTTLSAAAVAAGLAGDVDGDYSVVELANNGTLSGSTFTLSRTGTSFEVSVSVERNSTSASVEVVNTNTVHERQITIDAADTGNSTGSTWTMLATPAGGVATTIATWTDTSGGTSLSAAAVAAGLAGDVDGDYSVVELANNGTLSGSTFTLSRTGTSFEVSVSVERNSTSASVEVVNTNTVHERQITIDAADTVNSTGSTWTMLATPAGGVATTIATWTDTSGGTTLSAAAVAAGLAGAVSGDYSVVELANNGTLSGSTFTLSRTGTSFEVAVSVTRTSGEVGVSLSRVTRAAFDGFSSESGDWSVTVSDSNVEVVTASPAYPGGAGVSVVQVLANALEVANTDSSYSFSVNSAGELEVQRDGAATSVISIEARLTTTMTSGESYDSEVEATTLTLTGTTNTGDQWNLSLDGAVALTHTVTTDSLALIENSFVAAANEDSNYRAFNGSADGVLYLVRTSRTPDVDVAVVFGSAHEAGALVKGEPERQWSYVVALQSVGDNAENGRVALSGDTWSLTYDGASLSGTAGSDWNDLTGPLESISSQFPAGFDSEVGPDNLSLLVSRDTGGAIVFGEVVQLRQWVEDQSTESRATNLEDWDKEVNGEFYLTAALELNGTVSPGEPWQLAVDGTTYTYSIAVGGSLSGDYTLQNIARGLAEAINADSASSYTASAVGVEIRVNSEGDLTYPNLNPFQIIAEKGDGTSRHVFDLDSVNQVRGGLDFTVSQTADRVEYTARPVLELFVLNNDESLTSIDTEVLFDGVRDPGSLNAEDPIFAYNFGADGNYGAGTYVVRVSTCREFDAVSLRGSADFPFPDGAYDGVEDGMSYDLIISAVNHDQAANTLDLVGTELRFVGTDGETLTANIEAYDAANKIFVLGQTAAGSIGDAEAIISALAESDEFTLFDDFLGASPVLEDSYEVVLTGAPEAGEIVTITIDPERTRTLNSDEAFNPLEYFGEQYEEQVEVATTRAVVSLVGVDSTVQITIDPDDTADSASWTLTVTDEDGVAATFIWNVPADSANHPTAADVATGLEGIVFGTAGTPYSVEGEENGTLTLSRLGKSFDCRGHSRTDQWFG